MTNEKIPYSDFAKLTLQVGKILEVEDHPNADKLYILKVDIHEKEPRQIIAGLKPYYSKEELLNKKAIFITNLEPATIRGIESNGMILAASHEEKVIFLSTESDIKEGSNIK
jgi:methionyl-tRNA synthetase